ncbi:MAG: phage holin family protein [Actinomycetes bacterium]
MGTFLIRLVVSALALWAATGLVDGISVGGDTDTERALTLLCVALVFGLINAVVKPVVSLLSLPFILLTLGLFLLVVNALMLWLTAAVTDVLGLEFDVSGFWPAFWGALVVTVVSWALGLVLPDRD